MDSTNETLLKSKMSDESYRRLTALDNPKLFGFVAEAVRIGQPDSVYFCDDSEEDAAYIRKRSLELGEERALAKTGHTIHYDGYGDQARDKANTRLLVPAGEKLGGNLNVIEREAGLAEVKALLAGAMKGKQALVKLFTEGPPDGPFSIGCVQITDSTYVVHSEDILYRRGYEYFMKMPDKDDFFCFFHSAGELDARGNSINLDERRIYQDLDGRTVYSVNDQYAGNSVGLKKHSMRLAIRRSDSEGWLCEHMFIMCVPDKEKDRRTYFCGAFPSMCGKTSTAMIPGEEIVGDDIAYFRNIDGEFRAVNVERGIFGIIQDVNAGDDPVIFETLMAPDQEVIFSNVLVHDGTPYWSGMNVETPTSGENHSGQDWHEGKKDAAGNEISISHKNSRYTVRLDDVSNIDTAYEDPMGVVVDGLIYGGRDSDSSVPIEESFDWTHGIITKACTLESETTAAILGKEGVRVFQPMANLDFISYPIGRYIQNNLDFVAGMKQVPRIFCVNYFLKQDGEFCTSKLAKKVWLHWAEKRVHGDCDALPTPTGLVPAYADLKMLFAALLDYDYSTEEYEFQFSCRVPGWLDKIERIAAIYRENVPDTPQVLHDVLDAQRQRLQACLAEHGACIKPGAYR